MERLEGYRRIGMLEELAADYVPEIARLVERLEEGVARQDLQECIEIMHSLVGMSGEAGARALHQLARRFYVPMVEKRCWPLQADWPGQISALAAETDRALKDYTQHIPSPGAS